MYEGTPLHEPGTVLKDTYEIHDLIARGSTSRVYRARRAADGKALAIKELFMHEMDLDRMEQTFVLFEQEGDLLRSLHHPGLVEVLDTFASAGRRYIVMPFLEGDLLDKPMQDREPPAEVATVLEWIDQVCDVLVYLHAHNPVVVVRDLHPGNIVLAPDKKHIHIIDLGIAKTLTGKETRLRDAGTPGFVPVEQLAGGVDERADIYALGATLYALLTHQVPPPFGNRLLEDTLQEPDKLNQSVPKPLNDLIVRMLNKRKQDRPESVAEVQKELRQVLDTLRPKPAKGAKPVKAAAAASAPAPTGKADDATPKKAGCMPLIVLGLASLGLLVHFI